ncbi:glycoside hydrolase family 13 protein [bacterium]|nr:glycoside hydrolase family 13 protein [bacterium]
MIPKRDPVIFQNRRNDWRYGHLIYQVFLDRFEPSSRLESKAAQYLPPRRLRGWDEVPERGEYLEAERNSRQELDFWGGDLASFLTRVDYLKDLGIDVVYFNPIFEAFTNHKYDASDYTRVDPQYGTNEELRAVAAELHRRGMRLLLDGVFNHMGRRAPAFEKALATGEGADFFVIGEQYRNGYRGWRNVRNLPEINLENPVVRDRLWRAPGSIVRRYLTEVGIDGWRLDVAPDVGFDYLAELTAAAHDEKPDSVVIGECWNYPEEWVRCVDGIMNMHARTIAVEMVNGRMKPSVAMRSIERMIEDGGQEALLRCHFVLDNHDLPRLRHVMPDDRRRALLRFLQFTLPGCPVIYYGSELGMEGGHDPLNRAPMRWDLLRGANPELEWVRRLIAVRRENAALRIGDLRALDADRFFAFLRLTDRARETLLVIANPTEDTLTEVVQIRDSRWMDAAPVTCLLSGKQAVVHCGLLEETLAPWEVRIYRTVDQGITDGYSMLKRVP